MLFRFAGYPRGEPDKIYGPRPLSGLVRDYAERTDCVAAPQELADQSNAWRPTPTWAAEYPSLLANEEQQAEMQEWSIVFDRLTTVAMADALLNEAARARQALSMEWSAPSPEAARARFSLTAESPMVYLLSDAQGEDGQICGPIPLQQLVGEYGARADCRAASADNSEEWHGMTIWGLYLRRLSAE